MEPRKLIRLGNSSFAIALPKDWIDKSGLCKGDEVFVERNNNGEITISPKFKKAITEKKTEISVDAKDEDKIKREFTSDYIGGNSIFHFLGAIDKNKSRIIKDIIKDYISCEVVEENEKEIIVKDFFNFEEIDLNNFVKRMDNNLREMFEITAGAVEKGVISKKELEELEKIDGDINKFYFLNSRIMTIGISNPSILSKLKIEAKDLFNNWWLVFHMEHSGDNLKAVAGKLRESPNKESIKKILPLIVQLKDKYTRTFKSFYSHDKKEAYNIMEEGKKILAMCHELSNSKDAFLVYFSEKLKEINNASYQIAKMISYLKN